MRRLACLALAAAGLAAPARADFVVTIEQPGVQASSLSNTSVETFDAAALGNYPSFASAALDGTYTASAPGMRVHPANTYGGAGQSQYMAVGAQSAPTTQATLALNTLARYFGFYWGAGDSQNALDLYVGNTLLGSVDLAALRNGSAVTPAYYGNPNTGQNTGEPYVFVNVFATNGTAFDRVVFRNLTTGTGFETDNHTVRLTEATPTGTPVQTIPAPAVPAPAALPLAVVGLAVVALRRRRA